MKGLWILLALVVASAISALVGYSFGFRQAWSLGVAADALPRGVIASQQLKALKAGKLDFVSVGLESDVDNGLIWGYEVLHHPMRDLLGPLSGASVYPEYEKYATRLADYRKLYPSQLKQDTFDTVPPGKEEYTAYYRELARGAREGVERINWMVERYASKP
jgi:hypothetical protein